MKGVDKILRNIQAESRKFVSYKKQRVIINELIVISKLLRNYDDIEHGPMKRSAKRCFSEHRISTKRHPLE